MPGWACSPASSQEGVSAAEFTGERLPGLGAEVTELRGTWVGSSCWPAQRSFMVGKGPAFLDKRKPEHQSEASQAGISPFSSAPLPTQSPVSRTEARELQADPPCPAGSETPQ